MKNKTAFKLSIYNTLLTVLILFSAAHLAHAQGKAYEMVYYTAKVEGAAIKLNYADGYPGASNIKIKQSKGTVILLPESGAPDENGELLFLASSIDKRKTYILLKNISELSEAPNVIGGVYFINGRPQPLVFKRGNQIKRSRTKMELKNRPLSRF